MITIDLNFRGIPGAIASYLLPHSDGVALVECGPGSTIPALLAGLRKHGYTENDVSAVLVTHIHLDHAGAAGWFARQGAQVYVHPIGAPHMLNPEKLLGSARRIYGDQMETLWGEFLPVPEEQLTVLEDNTVVEIGDLHLRALDTPGHANHHFVYIYNDLCFTGDVGAVRMPGTHTLSLPMVPPEFILEKWRTSLKRLQNEYEAGSFSRIVPTHFGEFSDTGWHLAALGKALDDVEAWMERVMPGDPQEAEIMEAYKNWVADLFKAENFNAAQLAALEAANPSFISVAGMQRYWKKFRTTAETVA